MDGMVIAEDQSPVVAVLADPASHGGARVRRIDTQGAMVFLAGDRAYKIKRAVHLPYMDFSTLAARRRACEAELRLNRRTAPELYLHLSAVVRQPGGGLALAREGAPLDGPVGAHDPRVVEWVVVMRRFPDDALLDHIAREGRLTVPLLRALAEAIATFHEEAEPRPEPEASAPMGEVAGVVLSELRRHAAGGHLPTDRVERLARAMGGALADQGALLDRRRTAGYVRHCHGDLHLRNIVLIDGRPVPFDCLEFDDAMATTDVLYDLAFLLMDLEHRGLRSEANIVFNRYLELTGDLAGLALLPLFLAVRAGIRAHIALTMAGMQETPEAADAQRADGARYLDLALSFMAPPGARLVAIGGLSGTGKTTLARNLAPALGPAPGAVILRSDVLRKRLLGVEEDVRLPPEGYADAVTTRVYAEMEGRAGLALDSRHAVICDAVYARPDQRATVEAIARDADMPFKGLWLVADQATQLARVGERTGDASDATADIVRRQAAYDLGDMRWDVISANGDARDVAAVALRLLAP